MSIVIYKIIGLINLSNMKSIQLGQLELKKDGYIKICDVDHFLSEDVKFEYFESRIFSFLKIKIDEKEYLIKKVRSIWEMLDISTYDHIEKREDNTLFDTYCKLKELI